MPSASSIVVLLFLFLLLPLLFLPPPFLNFRTNSYFNVCVSSCLLFIRRDSRAFCQEEFMSGCSCQGAACPVLFSPWTARDDWGFQYLRGGGMRRGVGGAGSSVQGSRVEESVGKIRVGVLALALPVTSYVTLHRSFKLPDCTVFT